METLLRLVMVVTLLILMFCFVEVMSHRERIGSYQSYGHIKLISTRSLNYEKLESMVFCRIVAYFICR